MEQNVSWATSPAVRRSMRGNRRRDTALEMVVRRALHAQGLRYRVDYAPLPGLRSRADVVFTRARVAVYLDGCFWHCCPNTAPRRSRTRTIGFRSCDGIESGMPPQLRL
jgi:DNA mismatch endonuclease, patch repair protein